MMAHSLGRFRTTVHLAVCLSMLLAALLAAGSAQAAPALDSPASFLKSSLDSLAIKRERVFSGDAVAAMAGTFYSRRGYLPAWVPGYRPSLQSYRLIESVERARAEGLRPEFYRIAEARAAADTMRALSGTGALPHPESIAQLDLLLTLTFFSYASDILAGRVNPAAIKGEWSDSAWEADLPALLESALASDMLPDALGSLAPAYRGYYGLRTALARYRLIEEAGGWPHLPEGPPVGEGGRDPRVPALRERLALGGGIASGPAPAPEDPSLPEDSPLFDAELARALSRFQARHGLGPTGSLDPDTLLALNVPVSARIGQIELNMERWRWLPRSLGRSHIFVNIADYSLALVEDDREIMSMKIVIGTPYSSTPSFSSELRSIVLNPSWNVPAAIARHEIVPAAAHNPEYISSRHMKIYGGWEEGAPELSYGQVDWTNAPDSLRLVQPPGPGNPLGRIKFVLPNRFDVYLHDTPARRLFDRPVRAFSHGCIRLQRPLDLAVRLLGKDPAWTPDAVRAALDSGVELAVRVPEPRPLVHLLYWTAWVGDDGEVEFRPDVYGRDEELHEALFPAP